MARGKRVGARRKRQFRPILLLLALGITLCVVAWGYLVYAAIDFGTEARQGETSAWAFLALAAVGAAACLFAGLMLAARLSRALGLTSPAPSRRGSDVVGLTGSEDSTEASGSGPSRSSGGRRAAS